MGLAAVAAAVTAVMDRRLSNKQHDWQMEGGFLGGGRGTKSEDRSQQLG